MTESIEDGTRRGSARRRLVRGAFAAPAVLTLHSGSAFAAASNLRSLANVPAAGAYPIPQANPTDTWVRVRVYQSNGNPVVSGTDVAQYQFRCLGSSPFVLRDRWATVADPSASHTPSGGSTPNQTNQYAALRFATDGTIIGVSMSTSGTGTPVALSSWMSINLSGTGCS